MSFGKRRARDKARVEAHAEHAAENPWVERLARVGLVAQGVSFALVAVLAIELVLGKGGKATDRQGRYGRSRTARSAA